MYSSYYLNVLLSFIFTSCRMLSMRKLHHAMDPLLYSDFVMFFCGIDLFINTIDRIHIDAVYIYIYLQYLTEVSTPLTFL